MGKLEDTVVGLSWPYLLLGRFFIFNYVFKGFLTCVFKGNYGLIVRGTLRDSK